MVGSPAARRAVAIARRTPSLRVGLHVVLVEAKPVLPADQIRRLIDRDGFCRTDLALYGAEIFCLPSVRRQIQAEVAAQFAAFRATGLRLDHVNAHRHFHLHPTVAAIVIPLAAQHGAPFLRVPEENGRIIAAIDRRRGALRSSLIAPFIFRLRARARSAGLRTADWVFGLSWSGAMTGDRLKALAARLPDGVTEIYTHPATRAGFAGAAPHYRYADELAALTAPDVVAAFAAIRRCGFGDID
jgi:hopanoid biosynthesis associated protein HpnK